MRAPTGRVQTSVRPVRIAEGVVVVGRKPMLVCELRVASARNRKAVNFWAEKLGLSLRRVQVIADDALEAFEVVGSVDALSRFVTFDFVQSYHLPVATRVGFVGSGTGELKPRHVQASIRDRMAWGPKRQEAMPVARLDRRD